MQDPPEPVSIPMAPYGKEGASGPATAFGPTVTTSFPPAQRGRSPPDFVLWSFFNTLFCNACCLGFVALVFSMKARDRKVLGDVEGARQLGQQAKVWNIVASVVMSVILVITIILVTLALILLTGPIPHS